MFSSFKDDELARLLDSPDTDELEIPHSDVTPVTPVRDHPGALGSPIALESPRSDHLQSPRPDSSDGLEEDASRFFRRRCGDKEAVASTKMSNNVPMTTANIDYCARFKETVAFDQKLSREPSPFTAQEQATSIVDSLLEHVSEVDPSLYRPAPFQQGPGPQLYHLSIDNRPKELRRQIPVQELFASPMHRLWQSKFNTFNHLQSEVSNTLAHSDDSIVVSAPTGAGKTALFEIAMARFFAADLRTQRQAEGAQQQITKRRKAVYVAPSKALCEERYDDWTRRLVDIHIGIQCAMITGESEPGDSYRDVSAADVIVTTPEKWDSLTRRWTENLFLFGTVKLLMIDEVHLLGHGNRGCCLESIVCRMKTIQRAAGAASRSYSENDMSSYSKTSPEALSSYMRIVAVSATLPNVSSIASFLEASKAYSFDSSFRPVPLTTHVVGLGHIGKNAFMFGKGLDRHVPEIINRFSHGKSTIVFCHTKKETETLAMELSRIHGIGKDNGSNAQIAGQTRLAGLQRSLLRGVAYHHAGLEATDRKLVETAFADGKVTCLCATSTLAMGVNLPAHLVVIKGTVAWRGSGLGHQEIDSGTLLQMMGRAGRPGYDTTGTAVIMTDNASKQRYEELSGGLEIVESQLPAKIMDVMNTEICQRVVTSESTALNWIKSTFFARRATENPTRYDLVRSSPDVDSFLQRLCQDSLRQLHDQGIIHYDESGEAKPLPASRVMSQHMVDFTDMKRIVSIPFDAPQAVLLAALSEFEGLHRPVRRSEKKILNQCHKHIRYKVEGPPSKVRIQTPAQKTFVLLQAAIGQHYLEDLTLRQEMSYMVEYATRMLSAAEEFSIEGSKHGQVALQSLLLRRSFATSLWGAGDGILNQLRGVGHKTTAKLRLSRIMSFSDVLRSSNEAIEHAAGRRAPFGTELRSAVSKILQSTLHLSADVESEYIVCRLSRRDALGGMEGLEKDETAGIVKYTLTAYTDHPGSCLFFQSNIGSVGEYRMPFPAECGKVFVHLIASMVGLDERLELEGKGKVQESAFTGSPTKANAKPCGKRKGFKAEKQGPQSQSPMDRFVTKGLDVRIPSRSMVKQKADENRASANAMPKKQRVGSTQNTLLGGMAVVTPSSFAQDVFARKSNTLATVREEPAEKENRPSLSPNNNGSKRLSGPQKYTWKQEKRSQRNFQQSAFRRKKDNPFALYSYDPNDIESTLDALATSSKSVAPESGTMSIIPPHALSTLKQTPRTGFSGGRNSLLRGSGRKCASRSANERGRRRRIFPGTGTRLPDLELLRIKAMEQQAYYADAADSGFHGTQGSRVDPTAGHQNGDAFAGNGNFADRNSKTTTDFHNFDGSHAHQYCTQDSIFPTFHPMRHGYHDAGRNSVSAYPYRVYPTSQWIEPEVVRQPAFAPPPFRNESANTQPCHFPRGNYAFEDPISSQQDPGHHDLACWSQPYECPQHSYGANVHRQPLQMMMPGPFYDTQHVTEENFVINAEKNGVEYTQGKRGIADEEDALFDAAFIM